MVTYYSLASGFLSGKYRSKADLGKSKRGESTAKYLDERGLNILKALDTVSARHQAKPAEIALAWLMARDGVTAPIASATSVTQVESFARAANLMLTAYLLQLNNLGHHILARQKGKRRLRSPFSRSHPVLRLHNSAPIDRL